MRGLIYVASVVTHGSPGAVSLKLFKMTPHLVMLASKVFIRCDGLVIPIVVHCECDVEDVRDEIRWC